MKYAIRILAALAFVAVLPTMTVQAQDDGAASLPVILGPFPDTENMEFLGQVTPDEVGALPVPGVWSKGMMNDIGGWTSPSGEEYALATNSGGIAFVRVTDPRNPVFLGKILSQDPFDFRNIWGDPDTFGNYGYFVTEIDDSNVVIVDLSGLDALGAAPGPDFELDTSGLLSVSFFNGGGYDGSHNVVINEDTGFAYLAGVHLKSGAANNACGAETPARFNTLILDLNTDPADPTVAACVDNAGEHDFHVANYSGPDTDHAGQEILFVFDGRDREGQAAGNPLGGFTLIWDVTDKSNIIEIARFRVPGLVFSHNGSTTGEQDFLFIGDEIDELVLANWSAAGVFTQPLDDTTIMPRTGTYIIDIRDLDNPMFFQRFDNGTVGLDHNNVVKGDRLYIASYNSGTRVFQIGRAANGDVDLTALGHTDSEPRLPNKILNIKMEERFGNAFLGQWGIFVFDSSDTIIASDLNNGVIITRLSDAPCQGIACSLD